MVVKLKAPNQNLSAFTTCRATLVAWRKCCKFTNSDEEKIQTWVVFFAFTQSCGHKNDILTMTCCEGQGIQFSGLASIWTSECWVSGQWQGLLALLSPWQLNYSLKQKKAQGTLLISQWDCWLSSQNAVHWKKTNSHGCFEMICE